MKKITLCLGMIAISLTSCSSDDSGSATNSGGEGVLLKKIVYTDDTNTFNETIIYSYNGNKLVQGLHSDGSIETFTYTGDLITQIQITEETEVTYKETFEYDSSNRLIEYHAIEDSYDDQETFVYNADGTVTNTVGTELVRTLTFQNDELVQSTNNGVSGEAYTYSYDGKNSPFRNVTGYSKIVHVVHGDHEFYGRTQNITYIQDVSNDIDYMTNTMTYNTSNFPTSVTSVAVFEGQGTYTANVQYFYE